MTIGGQHENMNLKDITKVKPYTFKFLLPKVKFLIQETRFLKDATDKYAFYNNRIYMESKRIM